MTYWRLINHKKAIIYSHLNLLACRISNFKIHYANNKFASFIN